jgi:predicted GIY-YIG superfamily endonuclease
MTANRLIVGVTKRRLPAIAPPCGATEGFKKYKNGRQPLNRRSERRRLVRDSSALRSGGGALKMNNFYYVYVLQSLSHPNQIYTGITADLKNRLAEHNSGRSPHTADFTPWEIRTATAFKSKERAAAFERYLKSGSGRVFLHRHL